MASTAGQARFEGRVSLIGSEEHPHAARRLRGEFPSVGFVDAAAPTDGLPSISLSRDAPLAEGAFAIDVSAAEAPSVAITGGPFSGVIYGVEELIQRLAKPDSAGF